MPHFFEALIAFAGYFGCAVAFCVAHVAIYTWMTPHREFDLIVREHNASAAVALGGSVIGFVVPLARAMSQALSIAEFAAWAVVALVVQIAAYHLARLTHPDLSRSIEANALSAALWVGTVSLGAGLLSAAAMTE